MCVCVYVRLHVCARVCVRVNAFADVHGHVHVLVYVYVHVDMSTSHMVGSSFFLQIHRPHCTPAKNVCW